ncbi:peptidase M15 [Candidatus Aerophobetes bacterium]|uniref:Peptidase M15 n=1 Tax=Aerophobetes bacterium TaxID=2030807 RepID=A0A662D0T5_UNCAE|nr:MAG: peptidase M15 [Candidatus Aerophobetes bacterium]
MVRENDIWISQHFRLLEFEDHRTREVKIDPRIVVFLEYLRTVLGRPIFVTSGYRTPETNREIGGAWDSRHMLGRAVDFTVDVKDLAKVGEMCRKIGFTGVEVDLDRNYIHAEIGKEFFVIKGDRK